MNKEEKLKELLNKVKETQDDKDVLILMMIQERDKQLEILEEENANLPLVFMMNNDEVAGDYGCTVMEDFRAYKSEIYKYERWGDLVFSDDVDEVIEYYSDTLADEEKYEDLSQEEYEEVIKNYVNQNIEHYEAIVLYVR